MKRVNWQDQKQWKQRWKRSLNKLSFVRISGFINNALNLIDINAHVNINDLSYQLWILPKLCEKLHNIDSRCVRSPRADEAFYRWLMIINLSARLPAVIEFLVALAFSSFHQSLNSNLVCWSREESFRAREFSCRQKHQAECCCKCKIMI